MKKKSQGESPGISSVLSEKRSFRPTKEFTKNSHIKSMSTYKKMWEQSVKQPKTFWSKAGQQKLSWIKPFKKVLTGQAPDFRWFEDGRINASVNCIERHISIGKANKAAIIWEGEPGEQRTLTYLQLHRDVCKAANMLRSLGVKAGDRVTIYLPLIPEAVIAMHACNRIGAIHTVVFAGFSSEALAERNNDASSKVLITADGGFRRGQIVDLKANADEALKKSKTIEHVIVVKRTHHKVSMEVGRDHWWSDLTSTASHECEAFEAPSEHPLFILYTSGSTGKPKGIYHTTAGYLLGAMLSTKYLFDLQESDTYWCTADVGWVTGHTYVAYGPLLNGATIFMYEGAPHYPDPSRLWGMVERHKVSILYTAPTAIRACVKAGEKWPLQHDLSSLRLLGTVGEPINPEAWMWFHTIIGKSRCPIVDTWWQTETGSAMISPLPGFTATVPGCATFPFLGIEPAIVDKHGKRVPKNTGGYLIIKKPWPSMLRGIWGDETRYQQQYWSQIKGCYFTGDGARQDDEGRYWILGRIDDVLNVSGHRLSTMEIESSIVSHESVAEAAVVGRPDDLKGESIMAFVTLKENVAALPELKDKIKQHVTRSIGGLARPDEIRFTETLPKTRSGKIMRRLLREIASGQHSSGDLSTLEDLGSLAKLRDTED